jgi:hypothetical protein
LDLAYGFDFLEAKRKNSEKVKLLYSNYSEKNSTDDESKRLKNGNSRKDKTFETDAERFSLNNSGFTRKGSSSSIHTPRKSRKPKIVTHNNTKNTIYNQPPFCKFPMNSLKKQIVLILICSA